MPTYSGGARVSPISALVGAFGEAFANTHNRNIQQQLQIRQQQDSSIAETLVKSGADDPTLWDNTTFMKAAKDVLGSDNAAAVAEAQKAHAASPLGQVIKALGEGYLGAPVSGEADGPGTGPTVPFGELPPQQRTALAQARLAKMTPAEAGLGLSAGVGNLVRDSAAIARRDPVTGLTPPEQAKLDLGRDKLAEAKQNRADTASQKQTDVERRNLEFRNKIYAGKTEMRQTPVGERMVKVFTDPNDGQTYVTPVGALKQTASPEGLSGQMRELNVGIGLSHQLIQMARKNPDEIAQLFTPIAGKRLVDLEKGLGGLSDTQRTFVNKLLRLRNARITAQGGKQLTENEARLYNEVLPSDFNTTARMMGLALEDTQDGLIMQNAINENAAGRNRQASAKTNLFSPQQRAIYKRYRAAAMRSFRHDAQIPLLPNEKLFTGNIRDFIKLPRATSSITPSSTATPDDAAFDSAFLAPE